MKSDDRELTASRVAEILATLNKGIKLATDLYEFYSADLHPSPNAVSGENEERADSEQRPMHVYWIGCSGLRRAAERLRPHRPAERLGPHQRIDRIGCTTEEDLSNRLSTASADAYGSWYRGDDGKLTGEDGFTSWIMQAIKTTRKSYNPDITVNTRSITVHMPASMTRRSFDAALRNALRPWSLSLLHPAAERFTNYSVGRNRMSRATEFYTGLDPRTDGDRLLGLVEGILEAHAQKERPRGYALSRRPNPKGVCRRTQPA